MVSEGTEKLQIIIAEMEEALEALDTLEDLWHSTNWPNYKFAAALHEFVKSKHYPALGFRSISTVTWHMDIPEPAAIYLQRIYRELTLKRGVPIKVYEHLDGAKIESLMSLLGADLYEGLRAEAFEIGSPISAASWRVWIDGAMDKFNSNT